MGSVVNDIPNDPVNSSSSGESSSESTVDYSDPYYYPSQADYKNHERTIDMYIRCLKSNDLNTMLREQRDALIKFTNQLNRDNAELFKKLCIEKQLVLDQDRTIQFLREDLEKIQIKEWMDNFEGTVDI